MRAGLAAEEIRDLTRRLLERGAHPSEVEAARGYELDTTAQAAQWAPQIAKLRQAGDAATVALLDDFDHALASLRTTLRRAEARAAAGPKTSTTGLIVVPDGADDDKVECLSPEKRTELLHRGDQLLTGYSRVAGETISGLEITRRTSPTLVESLLSMVLGSLSYGLGGKAGAAALRAARNTAPKAAADAVEKGVVSAISYEGKHGGTALGRALGPDAEVATFTVLREALRAWEDETGHFVVTCDDEELILVVSALRADTDAAIRGRIKTAAMRWETSVASIGSAASQRSGSLVDQVTQVVALGTFAGLGTVGKMIGKRHIANIHLRDGSVRLAVIDYLAGPTLIEFVAPGYEEAALGAERSAYQAAPIDLNVGDLANGDLFE